MRACPLLLMIHHWEMPGFRWEVLTSTRVEPYGTKHILTSSLTHLSFVNIYRMAAAEDRYALKIHPKILSFYTIWPFFLYFQKPQYWNHVPLNRGPDSGGVGKASCIKVSCSAIPSSISHYHHLSLSADRISRVRVIQWGWARSIGRWLFCSHK